MASPIVLPRQGQSVESCIITEWKKAVGDEVKAGDILFTYETDKATFDETAKEDGTLLAVFFQADDDVPVLTTVGVIGKPGEDISSFSPAAAEEAPAAPAATEEIIVVAAPEKTVSADMVATGVSPRARAAAHRLGVDLSLAQPSGPKGRIIERDVLAARAVQPAPAAEAAAPVAVPASAMTAPAADAYTDIKLSNVRRLIGKAMHQSLAQAAQLTHHATFDATQVNQLRARLKAAPKELNLPRITVTDLILFALSRVLGRHPDMNAHYLDDHIRQFHHAHIGVAVDTPRGLLVPTLFDADTKSLSAIAEASATIIDAALKGSINPDLLTGGTITVTNLGTLGTEFFTPIINPPQVAILGVGNMVERVRTVDGQITVYPAVGLSLTYDHRAVDGAPASRFLKDLIIALENIQVLLAN